MDIKFGKDSEQQPQQPVTENKGKQGAMLAVLLLLVCGFGYVYFFTDVIKPQQEQKAAEAPAPQVVKKPLPPSDAQPAKAETAAAPAAAPAAVAAATPAKPETAPAKPALEPKKADPAKPAVEPKKAEAAKPAVEPKKAEAAKPAAKPPVPAVAKAAPADKKPAATPEKKVLPVTAAVAKPAAVKPAEKKATAEPAVKKSAPKPEQKAVVALKEAAGTSDSWTLLVGNYLLEEALVTDLVRVRKAGLDASIVAGGQKKTKMNRLLLGEFGDRETAQVQLEKLKRYTSDAFIIDSAGKHVVYAGSYLLDARAGSEKERLSAAGFNLTIKRTDVSIGSKNLTAGVFADKKSADESLKKLKAAGINASVVRR
jgi:cell division septation protein DedD